MCCTIILNIFIIVIFIGCPTLNCMIHYNVCNDKGKYCAILWASGNYCGRLDLVIPLAHWVIGFICISHIKIVIHCHALFLIYVASAGYYILFTGHVGLEVESWISNPKSAVQLSVWMIILPDFTQNDN